MTSDKAKLICPSGNKRAALTRTRANKRGLPTDVRLPPTAAEKRTSPDFADGAMAEVAPYQVADEKSPEGGFCRALIAPLRVVR
jgi:hypothetical protein